jgi:integrase
MKMKRPHVVPLSSQALAILKEVKKQTGEKAHIFHSPASKSMHISNGIILMGLRRMGYKNKMTGHGFRTLASTILNEKGYPPDVIERQLAHEDEDKIRSAYNRAEYLLERKKMMQEYANLLETIGKYDKTKVTQFSKATVVYK